MTNMSFEELIRDPLIALVNAADNVDYDDYIDLLIAVASRLPSGEAYEADGARMPNEIHLFANNIHRLRERN